MATDSAATADLGRHSVQAQRSTSRATRRQHSRARAAVPGLWLRSVICDRCDSSDSRLCCGFASALAPKLLRNTEEEAAAWPKLRGEHADPGSVPDFVDRVEQIDDIEPQLRRLHIVEPFELVRDAEIHLRIPGKRRGIREAAAQATAVKDI